MTPPSRENLALVMPGGGARAAYQVGVLRCLARHHPDLAFPIMTGVSAGAINVGYLASRVESLRTKVDELSRLWANLEVKDVFRVDAVSLLPGLFRWLFRLVGGGRLGTSHIRGMVDTQPLRELLHRYLKADSDGRLSGIAKNIEAGNLSAVAITTSSYTTGQSITWVEGACEPWGEPKRRGRRAELNVDHIMGSSALPFLFPAIRIGNAWYGDGGIRLVAPLSPAVHLGADRILVVSTHHEPTPAEADEPSTTGYPPPIQVAGTLMNAIFLDRLDADAKRIERITKLTRRLPPEERGGFRPIETCILRPSVDLGRLSNDYEPRLPKLFRFLTRGLGTQENRSNDIMSMIMFQPDYLRHLIRMGEKDAEKKKDQIAAFLRGETPARDEIAA